MPQLTITYEGKSAGRTLQRNMKSNSQASQNAMTGTVQDVSKEILERGRADIAQAGHYGQRWIQGLQTEITESGGNQTITVFHSLPFFNFWQKGGVIKGHPLLWVKLSFAGLSSETQAKDLTGTLFRVDRKSGDPLLMDRASRQPMFVGKTSVKAPKKFHTVEIIRDIMNNGAAREAYLARFAAEAAA